MTQAAQHHRERCESEVSLGFAATGREEQQVYRGAGGIGRVGDPWQIQEQECQLKSVPTRRLDSQPLTESSDHSTVGDAERIQRVRILSQPRDAPLDPIGSNAGKTKELLRGLAPTSLQRGDDRSLGLDPRSILV